MPLSIRTALVLVLAATVVACSGDDGAPSSPSSGSSGSSGTTSSGSSGTTTSKQGDDAGAPPTSDAGVEGGGEKKALGEDCTANEQCESNECSVGDKNGYCSLRCTQENAATVCVAPFDGTCNKRGYCRRP